MVGGDGRSWEVVGGYKGQLELLERLLRATKQLLTVVFARSTACLDRATIARELPMAAWDDWWSLDKFWSRPWGVCLGLYFSTDMESLLAGSGGRIHTKLRPDFFSPFNRRQGAKH